MNRCRSWMICLGVLSAAQLAGCGGADGPSLGMVTGKVTLDGEPIQKLVVTFIPEQGGSPSYGATNASGEYTMLFTGETKGAVVGKHNVTIEAGNPEKDENGRVLPGQVAVKIPKKYQKPGELTADVKAGANTIDFALDSKK